MARAATTSDAFNAVAEPRRREILNYLALQERSVSEVVQVFAFVATEFGCVGVMDGLAPRSYRTDELCGDARFLALLAAVPRLHFEVENVHHNMGSLVQ